MKNKILSSLLLIVGLLSVTACNKQETKITDAEKFKNEYESFNDKQNDYFEYRNLSISEKNPFIGMKLRDILKKCDEKPELWEYMQHLSFKNGGESMDDIADLFVPQNIRIAGTSFDTPIRVAKLALNDMMQGIL